MIRLFAFAVAVAVAVPFTARASEPVAEATPAAEPSDGFVPLFDGESIDAWVQRGGKAKYEVVDGMIVGTAVANTPNSFLCTPRTYGDFVLELELKGDAGLNSGIMIRAQHREKQYFFEYTDAEGKARKKRIPAGRIHGYQVEIDHRQQRRFSGGIYDEARRGWIYDLSGDKHTAAREAFRFEDWNHYRIECRGDSIRTWVNGVAAADLKDDTDAEGVIGLQVHSVYNKQGVGTQIRWRNLRIKEL